MAPDIDRLAILAVQVCCEAVSRSPHREVVVKKHSKMAILWLQG